ncbi:type II toxin-antitoxin system YafQ family toxin [Mesoaciditoga lauensis]|uniref:type II toxin-antitoxin system YafQ family toxin n=1 Tax=Mesoaciditoga lauensis TaxID=1495039 RepID=UPI0005622B20|nr:type II toxin-antitoxin system YafQ family toxin [Mesoaciditoga lauensis]
MKYRIFRTKSFKKDYKKLSTKEKEVLRTVVIKIANGEKLDTKFKDHKLAGKLKNFRECHLKPNLLLIYRVDKTELELVRVGTHSELFVS